MQHRPLRPSPLVFSSHIEQQSPPGSSSPPAESPALSWSTSSMASSSSSSPTRSFYESSSFSTLQPHSVSSGILPQPWRKHPSTPGTAKRKQAYKSTSSTRSQEQGPSSTSSSSPTFNLGSGSRWHSQFTQSCQQRAKQDRSKAIASRRNGYIGDYVDYDRETREEIAILRKLALRDKQKSTQDRVKENDMTQQQLDRLYELEAELAAMEERAAEQEMLQYQEPFLEDIAEEDEDVFAQQAEEYRRSFDLQPGPARDDSMETTDQQARAETDDFDMLLDDEDLGMLEDTMQV